MRLCDKTLRKNNYFVEIVNVYLLPPNTKYDKKRKNNFFLIFYYLPNLLTMSLVFSYWMLSQVAKRDICQQLMFIQFVMPRLIVAVAFSNLKFNSLKF